MDEEDVKSNMDTLRAINNMSYERISQSALTCARSIKVQPFATQLVQPGNTMQILINSGNDFIYGPTTCMKLIWTVTNTNAGGGNVLLSSIFGSTTAAGVDHNGSILNAFRSVRCYHRSGQLLSQLDRANLYVALKRNCVYNRTARQSLDILLNNQEDTLAQGGGTVTRTSIIPLSLFLGEFATTSLMPPQLCAGMKLEFVLEQSNLITGVAGIAFSNFTPSLLTDSIGALDSVVREINEQTMDTESSGIQFTYETPFFTFQNNNGNTFSMDIQNNVTICPRSYLVLQAPATYDPSVLDGSQFRSNMYNNLSRIQWRLGAEYMPNQGSELTALNNGEAFKDFAIAAMSYPHQFGAPQIYGCDISGLQYTGTAAVVATRTAYGICLDRSPAGIAGKYSGVATNSARLLNVTGTFISNLGVTDASVVNIFVESVRVANLAGDSCVVDR
jgi:hypothetical protein